MNKEEIPYLEQLLLQLRCLGSLQIEQVADVCATRGLVLLRARKGGGGWEEWITQVKTR